jgi:hypothetical protein
MAKSIQTNFTLRLGDNVRPLVIGDDRVASKLDEGNHFYSHTYTVDEVGVCLGLVQHFLALKCERPVLIEFKRVDMETPTQILCERLFINHGDFGTVWLRVPKGTTPVITTVWYGTDTAIIDNDMYVNIINSGSTEVKKLSLKNIKGQALGVPIANGPSTYTAVDHVKEKIPTITNKQIQRDLPTFKKS